MLYVIERKRSIRTLRGWAISTLQDAGAIRQREYHEWLVDYANPNARKRALEIARQDLPANISPRRAITEMLDVLDGIGDTCPDCVHLTRIARIVSSTSVSLVTWPLAVVGIETVICSFVIRSFRQA
jgi:hypothetical protein